MRNRLPETFEEFLEVTDVADCRRCGETVRRRFLEDGVCVGCRHSPEATGGVADA